MKIRSFLAETLLACTAQTASAADDGASAAAQANNPLAKMTAFNIQDYYIGDLTEVDDSANQGWLRFAKPFSVAETNWLMRASLPINSFPTPPRGSTDAARAAAGKPAGIGRKPAHGLNMGRRKGMLAP